MEQAAKQAPPLKSGLTRKVAERVHHVQLAAMDPSFGRRGNPRAWMT